MGRGAPRGAPAAAWGCSVQAAGVCLLRLRRCPVTPASFPSQGSPSASAPPPPCAFGGSARPRPVGNALARGDTGRDAAPRSAVRLRARRAKPGRTGRPGVPPVPRPLGWAVRRRRCGIRRGIGPWPRAGPAEPAARCVCVCGDAAGRPGPRGCGGARGSERGGRKGGSCREEARALLRGRAGNVGVPTPPLGCGGAVSPRHFRWSSLSSASFQSSSCFP